VIAAAYYLLILKAIFLDKSSQSTSQPVSSYRKHNLTLNLALATLFIILIVLLIYPLPLLDVVHQATMALMYL
jgi:NADH:ubiquinone oxidoreductase subunit 2 (subunit N)